MFDDKTLKVQSIQEMRFPRLECECVPAWRALKQTTKVHFELKARPSDQIHTKYVKTAGLESIHSSCLKVNENSSDKIQCVSIFCLKVTDWCFINVNQRTKCKEKITHSF